MNKQNLIIFKLKTFYNVLKELESVINFKVFEAANEEQYKELKNKLDNYIVITSKKNQNFPRALYLEKFPIKIFKLIEIINSNIADVTILSDKLFIIFYQNFFLFFCIL